MSDKSFIAIYENEIPDGLCDRLVERHKELEELSSSTVTTISRGEEDNGGPSFRRDIAFYFERDSAQLASELNALLTGTLMKYMDEYPSLYMRSLYSQIVKVQKTPPKGGFHFWHSEHSWAPESAPRALVWMVYLNDVPDGEGTTEFLEFGVQIPPKKGTVVFFPPGWSHTHRGNPVYSTDKYIATGWYYYHEPE